ncbi:Protoporphyrinogen oxidase [Byssothecium circinans]|uniref:Protoporphyrinogen oxidase n=1 Tax=Byssothecium circinans TaxID=147558 RepID=A0A6A5U039_9PLEO|nr:Protoporphyrinogen oxidase [Byssothecium circinans]
MLSAVRHLCTPQILFWTAQHSFRRPAYHRAGILYRTQRLHTHRSNTEEPRRIAIIGGGITGLTTAYYSAKQYPSAQLTLFESKKEFGGVIESRAIHLKDGTTALCQLGPKTLRANAPRAIVMVDLITQLGLQKDLIVVSKNDPVASNRYIYYTNRLVRLPVANMVKSVAHVPAPERFGLRRLWTLMRMLLTEPLFSGLLTGLLRGIFTKRPEYVVDDDSAYNLLSRRLGKKVTNNFFSAVYHGLYAGDMCDLSARALCPGLWSTESVLNGPIWRLLWLFFRGKGFPVEKWKAEEIAWLDEVRNGEAGELEKTALKDGAVFNFDGGVTRLTDRLEEVLQNVGNVRMIKQASIDSIAYKNKEVCLSVNGSTTSYQPFTHIISTTSLPQTLKLLEVGHPSLTYAKPTISHVPMMTVCFVYSTPNLNRPHRGFGYLLSSSLSPSQNPENALGVVFDSDAIPNQDTFTGTKISVILGGHFWASRPFLPSKEDGVAMAKALLKRQLGIEEEPVAVVVGLERQALPQYRVGHYGMLREVHGVLGTFEGRVRVAGNCYDGIGVHDCLFSARRVVEGLGVGGRTGLEWCC